MGKVILVLSMSLDGFVTAAKVRPEEPMGEGGLVLHDWAMSSDARDREILTQGIGAAGAVVAGRRTYDDSVPWWGADGPTGQTRLPVFVVTHRPPSDMPVNGVYRFVDGLATALAEAQAVAGDKDISVMGGANLAQQFIRAGLLDELQIHLAPVLFGSGTRLFEHLGPDHFVLETVKVVATAAAIHMRFRVVR